MGTLPLTPSAAQLPDFAVIRDAIEADRNAVGYLPGADKLKPLRIVESGNSGVSPPDTYQLASGDYPLNEDLFLYRAPGRDNIEVNTFFREAGTVASQLVIMFAGHAKPVPQLVIPTRSVPSSDIYATLTRSALRVSTTIRFAEGSTEIDAAASRDLDVLSVYLRNRGIGGAKLLHIAFSDDTGDPARNNAIAEQLGAVVASELLKRHAVPGATVSLGASIRLASDLTSVGRRLNRRVETWIQP